MKHLLGAVLIAVVLAAAFLGGCAAIAQKATEKTGMSVSAGVETLRIETDKGIGGATLAPGESITLVAKGYDANSREVTAANVSGAKVNPTWEVSDSDMGSVDPKVGKTTTFTLSEDASGVFVTVSAEQEGTSEGTIMIQIQ